MFLKYATKLGFFLTFSLNPLLFEFFYRTPLTNDCENKRSVRNK